MRTLTTDSIKILTEEEAFKVCGGNILESEIGGAKYIDIYRAGVSFKKSFFGDDEFYIGGTRISKETADNIVRQSRVLWISKYMDSGDLVGFTKEWKAVLMNDYGVTWDGIMGKYSFKVF